MTSPQLETRNYSLTSVLHTSLGESAQVCYSEVCVISEKDQMMKTKHGGTKYVRYSEGYTIVHVCNTEVKLYTKSRNSMKSKPYVIDLRVCLENLKTPKNS